MDFNNWQIAVVLVLVAIVGYVAGRNHEKFKNRGDGL